MAAVVQKALFSGPVHVSLALRVGRYVELGEAHQEVGGPQGHPRIHGGAPGYLCVEGGTRGQSIACHRLTACAQVYADSGEGRE